MPSPRRLAPLLALIGLTAAAAHAAAQSPDPRLYQDMRWRMIGPFRGGRTVGAVGVAQQPNVFYIGVNNGGVWKTTDYGRTWFPIFDREPTGSIGDVAVAPSDPDIVYVGSGEGLQRPDLSTGDGMYRSDDGGRTWTHLGLRDGQQIARIVVDPSNPDRLFVAVLGHPYGPNEQRGIFRSVDGGRTFEKVLYEDENTGGIDVAFDPSNAQTVYAALWEAREAPWENGKFTGPGSGLFKSADGGTTWRRVGQGLPTPEQGLGRIGIGTSDSDPRRLYAVISTPARLGGIYRSDDGAETWRRTAADPRLWGREGDFHEVRVDPKNADIVYVANIVTWKSADGGSTFEAFRGAPGGDDYHRIWINPDNPDIILIASDQGAIITVNGGQTFSSWYNQPTAAFYHVSTDNDFPYHVCGGQQESGSACISSRGDEGQITFREWRPVAAEEYAYVAPDPLDPDIVYGGKVSRYDRRTHQAQNVAPRPFRGPDYRVLRTEPLVFSTVDPHVLYFASNTVWRTSNGGQSWDEISPDLTRKDSLAPASVGTYSDTEEARAHHPGVVYTVAPSYIDIDWIWAGTDDGLIHVTSDGGKTWRDVTPPDLRQNAWSKISLMDAGHFDTLTAYAAVNTLRLDDLRPHIYRTHDGGRTWTHITNGIPDGGIVNVVREDPVRPGLLFAGTEQAVYFSIDDGDHWQSLRQERNIPPVTDSAVGGRVPESGGMPATSIRDLVIKDSDLVAGTHGRGFWILDDITPLRQIDATTAASDVVLFKPEDAWRVRWNENTDTPLPPEEPAGQNPPDGAIMDYWLAAPASGPVTLEILDNAGTVVRRYASTDPPEPMLEGVQVPPYWVRPPQVLSADAGMHRFVWDLHYPTPPGVNSSYPIAAIWMNTPQVPPGPWVMPGIYTVRLTANGRTLTQPLTVKMDPRVETPATAIAQQFELSMRLVHALERTDSALSQISALRSRIAARGQAAQGGAIAQLDSTLQSLEGGRRGFRGGVAGESFSSLTGQLAQLLDILQDADVAPTQQAVAAIEDRTTALDDLLARWERVRASADRALR